eukprot:ANDGO_04801.mRNA.1 hypothetical protein
MWEKGAAIPPITGFVQVIATQGHHLLFYYPFRQDQVSTAFSHRYAPSSSSGSPTSTSTSTSPTIEDANRSTIGKDSWRNKLVLPSSMGNQLNQQISASAGETLRNSSSTASSGSVSSFSSALSSSSSSGLLPSSGIKQAPATGSSLETISLPALDNMRLNTEALLRLMCPPKLQFCTFSLDSVVVMSRILPFSFATESQQQQQQQQQQQKRDMGVNVTHFSVSFMVPLKFATQRNMNRLEALLNAYVKIVQREEKRAQYLSRELRTLFHSSHEAERQAHASGLEPEDVWSAANSNSLLQSRLACELRAMIRNVAYGRPVHFRVNNWIGLTDHGSRFFISTHSRASPADAVVLFAPFSEDPVRSTFLCQESCSIGTSHEHMMDPRPVTLDSPAQVTSPRARHSKAADHGALDEFLDDYHDSFRDFRKIAAQFSPLDCNEAVAITNNFSVPLVCSVADHLVSLGFAEKLYKIQPYSLFYIPAFAFAPFPILCAAFRQRFPSFPSLPVFLSYFSEVLCLSEISDVIHVGNSNSGSGSGLIEKGENPASIFLAVKFLMEHGVLIPYLFHVFVLPESLRPAELLDSPQGSDDDVDRFSVKSSRSVRSNQSRRSSRSFTASTVRSSSRAFHVQASDIYESDNDGDGDGDGEFAYNQDEHEEDAGSQHTEDRFQERNDEERLDLLFQTVLQLLSFRQASGKSIQELVRVRVIDDDHASFLVTHRDILMDHGLAHILKPEYEIPLSLHPIDWHPSRG